MSIELTDPRPTDRAEEILTDDALAFVEELHQRFAARRDELLAARGRAPGAGRGRRAWTSWPRPRTSAEGTGPSRRPRRP